MSVRNPKSGKGGKSTRTLTARRLEAIATDIEQFTLGLRGIASSYRLNEGDHSEDAANVDAALDHIVSFCRSPIWPRVKRTRLVRATNGKVIRAVELPAPAYVVIICAPCHRGGIEEDILRVHRNPRDRRIKFVSQFHDLNGLLHETPWFIYGPSIELLERGMYKRANAQFMASKERNLFDLISLLDWTK